MSSMLLDEPLVIESRPGPTVSVLFIHGLGAEGARYTSLVAPLSQAMREPVRFIFPTAPQRPVTICQGQRLAAWFDLISDDLVSRQDVAGLLTAEAYIAGLVAAEIEKGVDPGRIFVAGFSQGGALALLTGLQSQFRLGGIAALSGWLPVPEELDRRRSSISQETPIFIGHGSVDQITPLALALTTREWLEAAGSNVTWRTYPVGHSIAHEEIGDLGLWLRKCLS